MFLILTVKIFFFFVKTELDTNIPLCKAEAQEESCAFVSSIHVKLCLTHSAVSQSDSTDFSFTPAHTQEIATLLNPNQFTVGSL